MSGNQAYSRPPHPDSRRSITIDYDSTPTLELLRWMFAEAQEMLLDSLQPPPHWTRTNALLDQCIYFNDTWIPYLATRTEELAVPLFRVLFFLAAVAFEILNMLSVLFLGIYASSKTLDLDAPESFCWILFFLGIGLCTAWLHKRSPAICERATSLALHLHARPESKRSKGHVCSPSHDLRATGHRHRRAVLRNTQSTY